MNLHDRFYNKNDNKMTTPSTAYFLFTNDTAHFVQVKAQFDLTVLQKTHEIIQI